MEPTILRSEWMEDGHSTPAEDRLHFQGYDSEGAGEPSSPQEDYEQQIHWLKTVTGRKYEEVSSHYWYVQILPTYRSGNAIFRRCRECGAAKWEYCHYKDVKDKTGQIVYTKYPHPRRRRRE